MEPNVKFWRLVFQDDYGFFEQEHVAATERDIKDISFRYYSYVAKDAWEISPVDSYFDYLPHTKVFHEEISPERYLASL